MPEQRPKTWLNTAAPLLLPAAALTALEGAVAVVFGVIAATQVNLDRAVVTVGTVVVFVAYGVALLLAARGLLRERSWARGVTVAANVLHLPIAWSFAGPTTMWVAVALAAVSVAVLVCVFWPSSTRAFVDPNGPAGQH
ncbi:hypothetical protein ACQBAU_08280 [Propionibacteriaceae bacterium Y2011]|uniref:hypothetical protein n=1 Tax=Microlunatus sp. Y2014 TaxID=3418488 RepID=UPI003B47D796